MSGDEKNLKDISKNSVKDISLSSDFSRYYSRTNKLVTALYMVTDTMEKDEPIRLRLRTLGIQIISDTNGSKSNMDKNILDNLNERIGLVLSLLNISSDMRMISEMNCNILVKEFMNLKESVDKVISERNLWLEEFVKISPEEKNQSFLSDKSPYRTFTVMKEGESTRIVRNSQNKSLGVQKGGTLLNALNKRIGVKDNLENLKIQRRELLLKIIKDKNEGLSIKDIISSLKSVGQEIGAKTLQRELVSMVTEGILKKEGEKRWSKYSMNSGLNSAPSHISTPDNGPMF